ncbi:GAF domain-containing protein [Leptolinea tardivitalis]|uniref:GAF domain-containing protein n=1 Tax=Leptolinea tardivitalis TaxID=229920 RepID=UPI0007821DB5|nr:GAF domain-containing protein [Leptolinea tardivitalis]GAP20805.1 serine phosphatase RsbU, regulator of sigma subunit [Leptolinea tardivitalis]
MKSVSEKSLPVDSDWKRFLETAETLLQKGSLQEQSQYLRDVISDLFQVKSKFWFAHPFYPLPGEDTSDLVSNQSMVPLVVKDTFFDKSPHFSSNNSPSSNTLLDSGNIFSASLPVICQKDMLGILYIEEKPGSVISSEKISAIESLLALCAMSLQIYRQAVLKSWRVEQLSIVRKISNKITNITDIDSLCCQIAETVRDKFQYYYVAIYTKEKDEILHCRSCVSAEKDFLQNQKMDVIPGQGVIGWVADHKEELYVEDTGSQSVYQFHKALPKTRSEVALPLMIEDCLLGVLDVQSDAVREFHEMDLIVLRTLADNIAIAIDGARLFSDVQRKSEQISAVFDISHSLSSILDLDSLLNEIVNTIQQKFQYLQVNVYTVHKGRGKIIFRAGTGKSIQAYRDANLTIDINDRAGILPWVAREEKTFLSNDVAHEPQYRMPEFLSITAGSEISIPLKAAGELVGILDIQSDQVNAFDDNDRSLFEALAAGIATSIRNATLFRSEQFRRQVAESVRDVSGILSNGSSVEELMDRILEKLQEVLPCDASSIWLAVPSARDDCLLTLAASRGIQPHQMGRTYQTKETVGQWVSEAMEADEPRIRTQSDPRGPLGEALGFPQDYSAIAAPLRAGGEVVGILTLAHHQPDRYGTEARQITQTFAGYAAVAIQNNRLYGSIREQAWISAVLLKVAEANKEAQTLTALSETTAKLIPELIGCANCAVYYYNTPLNIFERKASSGFAADALPAKIFSDQHAAFLFASRIPSPIKVYLTQSEFCLTPEKDSSSGVLIPMMIRDKITGMIWVGSCENGGNFSQDTLQVLTGICNQTATAIENLRLFENQKLDAYIAAALLQVAQTVSSEEDLAKILDSILDLTGILAGVESAALFLMNTDQSSFEPLTRFIGIDNESIRSLGTSLIHGDFPLLDMVTDQNSIYLCPLNIREKTPLHWPQIKNAMRLKDALHKRAPEGGWLVGIPLSEKGDILGALIILEKSVAGNMLEKRMDLLTGIARQATLAIQNDMLKDKKLENEKLQQEFQFARDIQQTFLPRDLPQVKGWDVSSLWQPARQVGGDFFDFFFLKPGTFCAVVADVSDKGMPAALYMTVTRTLIRSFAQKDLSPGQILKKVNDLLLQDNPTGMFVTSTIIIGSQQSGTIRYANAGHNPPLLKLRSNQVVELPKGQIALGVLENQEYRDHSIEIEPGAALVMFTDGVTDTLSPDGISYSSKRLMKILASTRITRSSTFSQALENDLFQFRDGTPNADDVTVLVLHRS